MSDHHSDQVELPIADTGRPWPPAERFPHNFGTETVGPRVTKDLVTSPEPLLITGYAGIERLLGFFAECHSRPEDGQPSRIRVLVGVEPVLRKRRDHVGASTGLQQELREFWLGRGISLLNSRELLATLDLLQADRLHVRTSSSTRVHAKIYVGSEAVTLGSSNFTRPGLKTNLEANARFERATEESRYEEAMSLAENLWDEGEAFTEGFRDLLRQLLRKVTWQEALGRACAELIEGDWAPRHLLEAEERSRLWPSQEQGIAQALWVLENHGAVLVADATGSGKTRMGAHLLRAAQDRNWRMGRDRLRNPVLVCPPAVKRLWSEELADAAEAVSVFSHGMLSQVRSSRHDEVRRALRTTRMLSVDEAHNFLNRSSRRSRMVYGNVADNVVLLTATPINRGARDLLSIVELLGADNFEDAVLRVIERLNKKASPQKLDPVERERLRAALQEFVVRRTKDDLNRLIDRDPDAYRNALGNRCRYPRHEAVVFERDDPPEDCRRAERIREKAAQLLGVVNFQKKVAMQRFLRFEGWTEERFLQMRLAGASALAAYHVRSRLRSSRVALVEHVLGTTIASRKFGIEGAKSSKSGGVLSTLSRIAGKPPEIALDGEVPAWLSDPDEHRRATGREIAIYEEILSEAEAMSDHRITANAEYLLNLLTTHDRILAFDSHLISLHALHQKLVERGGAEVKLATGEGGVSKRRRFADNFRLDANAEGVIGLCSDALAEGLNLQGASAVVHLDLPSVIRILEQRIGRVDRMDSPHESVSVYWPQEPPEFRLKADDKLLWRLGEVEDLLGSNVPIPDDFARPDARSAQDVDVRQLIHAVESATAPDAAITLADAFARVRALVEGPQALLPAQLYEALRESRARILSSVAVVPSTSASWTFLAVGASDRSVPRWVLVEAESPKVVSTLDEVARVLRSRLATDPADVEFDRHAAGVLASALQTAEREQRALLPRRKQRALDLLGWAAEHYAKVAKKEGDGERIQLTTMLLRLLEPEPDGTPVDLAALADWWLQVIRPEWYARLTSRGKTRPARLHHLKRELKQEPISTDRLRSIDDVRVRTEPLDRRVVAAIVGVGR